MTLNLPLRLDPDGRTLADATGTTVAECRDAAAAAELVAVVNAAWRQTMAATGPVMAWRAACDATARAVRGGPADAD